MHRISCPRPLDRMATQRGIVLLLALIFLLLLTLVAAAEAALRGAERRLWSGAAAGALHCGEAPVADCHIDDPAHPNASIEAFRHASGWITEGATEYRGSDGSRDFTTLPGSGLDAQARRTAVLARNPVYVIEDLGPANASTTAGTGRRIYRITARATGGRPSVVRVRESVFAAGGEGSGD